LGDQTVFEVIHFRGLLIFGGKKIAMVKAFQGKQLLGSKQNVWVTNIWGVINLGVNVFWWSNEL
jgi:hypothetical protein